MTRRILLALATILVLAAGAVAFLWWRVAPPDEILGLWTSGGVRVLAEPMRPFRGEERVLILALDGVGDEALRTALREGRLPRLNALVGGAEGDEYAHGYAAPGVLSVLPSTTFAAWGSLYTGEPPGRTGVPGNEWFAREEMAFYAPAPVTVAGYEHATEVYTEDLLGGLLPVPTLFERADVRSHVVLAHWYRGADLLVTPDPGMFAEIVAAAVAGLTTDREVHREGYAELDETAVDRALEAMEEHGVPDLQVVYFPGVDLFTHVATDPVPDQLGYLLDIVDPAIGEILDVYRAADVLDDTWIVVVGDHGHVGVLDDDRHALGADGEDEPTAVLENTGFRLRPLELDSVPDDDYQAAVAYQGAIAYVYLADRSTCVETGNRCDWNRPPRLEEDVLPVVRAFDAASRTGEGVPELQGTLDLIFARENTPVGEDARAFRVWDGTRLVPVADYLAANPRPDLLELESRLRDLAVGPRGHRAGDILLLTRSGADRPVEERFYFSNPYRSWHGSPGEVESTIPLLVARSDRSGADIRERVRQAVGPDPTQLSIAPLVLDLLGR
ncbi:MAG TPA: alkaline phosphatase family protein [Longimicrobiales bacterium]|nr:alkaline phosphatase family protein [Longimicrobiales bacterium]